MRSASLLGDTAACRKKLHQYGILDTWQGGDFNNLAKLAAQICSTPITLVSLVDSERQWFKAKVRIEASETSPDIAFCAHAIHGRDVFVVPDATQDECFAKNLLVVGDEHLSFYAGMPLDTPPGQAMGTLCVLDRKTKQLRRGREQVTGDRLQDRDH